MRKILLLSIVCLFAVGYSVAYAGTSTVSHSTCSLVSQVVTAHHAAETGDEVKMAAKDKEAMVEKKWKIAGEYMEMCNCKVTCPCNFLSTPTEGYCNAILGFQINEGSYGKVDLKGQKVAVMVKSPHEMQLGGWKAAYYVDEGANSEQRGALQKIFSGEAGGDPKFFKDVVIKLLGFRFVPVDITIEGDKRSINIPGIVNSEIVARKLDDGRPIYLENIPLSPWLVGRLAQAQGVRYKYKDFDLEWDYAGRHGLMASFEWTGP